MAGLASSGAALAGAGPSPPPALRIVAEGLRFPEGPVTMKDGSLLFVEIERGTIDRLHPGGELSILARLTGGPNGLAIGPDGAVYIANNGGRFSFNSNGGLNVPGPPAPAFRGGMIQRLDLASRRVTNLYDHANGRPMVAPDDLVFDRGGAMWISDIGTTSENGGIFYARPDGTLISRVLSMEAPNGIGLSPDGRTLYVSATRSLHAFAITGPGRVVALGRHPDGVVADLGEPAIADSLKLQADGRVCVCTLLAGEIQTIGGAPARTRLSFPDPFTTNLAFGGPDMRDVWVTLSGTGRIARLRWPSAGLRPAFTA